MDRNVYRFSSLFLKYDDWQNLKRICEKEFCIDNRDFYPDQVTFSQVKKLETEFHLYLKGLKYIGSKYCKIFLVK